MEIEIHDPEERVPGRVRLEDMMQKDVEQVVRGKDHFAHRPVLPNRSARIIPSPRSPDEHQWCKAPRQANWMSKRHPRSSRTKAQITQTQISIPIPHPFLLLRTPHPQPPNENQQRTQKTHRFSVDLLESLQDVQNSVCDIISIQT